MEEYQVHRKIQEALNAIKEYENLVKSGKTGMWRKDINEGLTELNEKRHMLASSGSTCGCCGGSGRA